MNKKLALFLFILMFSAPIFAEEPLPWPSQGGGGGSGGGGSGSGTGVILGNYGGIVPTSCDTAGDVLKDLDWPYYVWVCTDPDLDLLNRDNGGINSPLGYTPSDSYEQFTSDVFKQGVINAINTDRRWSPLEGDGFYAKIPVTAETAIATCAYTYTTKTITGISSATPPSVTVADTTGLTTGELVTITGALGAAGIAHPANGGPYTITVTDGTHFTLQDLGRNNIPGGTAPWIAWASGGVMNKGTAPDISAIYLLNNSDGSCGPGGTQEQLCGCSNDQQIASYAAGALYPLTSPGLPNYPITVWRHMFSGGDSGGASIFQAGVPDWEGPWAHSFVSTAGDCVQDQWVQRTGHRGDPYLPVSGHSVPLIFRAGLSTLVAADFYSTNAAWGTVEGGNTDILLDPAAVAASTAWSSGTTYAVGNQVTSGGSIYYSIQAGTNHTPPNTSYWKVIANAPLSAAYNALKGVHQGAGVFYFRFVFYTFTVRNDVELVTQAIDMRTTATRNTFFTNQRSIFTGIQSFEFIAPAQAGSTSFTKFQYRLGLFPIGGSAPMTTSYAITGLNSDLSIPSGDPATGLYSGLIPFMTSCETPAPAWQGTTNYVEGQRVTNGGNTYVCITDHLSGGAFSVGSNWLAIGNAGVSDAYFGLMSLDGTVEHGF